ncbi:MAG: TonB-dependent receptor [Tannerellaceae bacterium]|jgi:TonB-linked SusC/RagA family outer membrane protein|nr:TonB-dependent receptor [Tannerellaceae bacterium]
MAEILNDIESQTDYLFVYNNQVDVGRKVTVRVNTRPVNYVLSGLLENSDIDFVMEGTHIILTKREAPDMSASQQNTRRITGTVFDNNGEAVIGANILEKGTTNGATTDMDGRFTLNVQPGATIIVSYVGFLAQEISTGSQSSFRITLVEDTKLIDEVVVIGYGVVKKSDLAGAVSSVSSKQFKDEPVIRLDDALQGRMAGVQVMNTTGMIGSGAKIRIRGTTSLNKSSDPLYVVDGIIGSNGALNTSDIESIEVLKDASATAIYGSRGANGVVLITTKKGREGRPQVTFESTLGMSQMAKKYDLLSPYEYALALIDIKNVTDFTDEDLRLYESGQQGIDWQELMTQTGYNQNYKLSVAGGTKAIKYLVSGEVLDQSAVTILSKYNRYQFRSNLDTEVTNWLRLVTDVRLARIKSHNTWVDMGRVINYSPTIRELKNPDTGIYNDDRWNNIDHNPYSDIATRDNNNYRNLVYGNLNLLFTIAKGLTLSVQGGINYVDNPFYDFQSATRYPGASSYVENRVDKSLGWQNTNNLTYTGRFGDHSLTAMGVFELSRSEWMRTQVTGTNLLTETVGYWNVGLASTRNASNSYSMGAMVSALGRVQYGYKGKYLATASVRADGSSKFQGDNKWGYFPSGALAWNIAEEDFMKDNGIFQQLKLRLSGGVIGNQAIDAYETLGMLSSNSYAYGTGTKYTGYWANTVATPNVQWERTNQYDVGLDFSILKQRLNVTIDWFMKDTKNLLNRKNIPNYNGGGTFWVNQGHVRNTGIEFLVNAIPLKRGDLSWESTLTATYIKNEVIDLAGEEQILSGRLSGAVEETAILKPGYPIGSFLVFDWIGIDEKTGVNMYRKADGTPTNDPSSDDRIITGQSNPAWSFGWNNTFAWKNLVVNAFFNAAVGYQRLNATRWQTASIVGASMFVTLRDAYYQGWDKLADKSKAEFPSLTNSDNKFYGNSSQFLEDAAFLKLKNLSVGYRVPKDLIKFADLTVSLSVQNLLTITGYKGLDPEVYSSNVDGVQGADYGAYPVPRTYTLGLKFDF